MARFVKVAKLGSRVHEMFLDGNTVGEALESAKISVDECEVRVNGRPAEMDTEIMDGDIITLIPEISGG